MSIQKQVYKKDKVRPPRNTVRLWMVSSDLPCPTFLSS